MWFVEQSLSPCTSVAERNLLADAAKIVDKNNKINKSKEDLRKIVTDGLSSLGYDSSICKSKWDKSFSYPAGKIFLFSVSFETINHKEKKKNYYYLRLCCMYVCMVMLLLLLLFRGI